nr:MAG TPA: hypothetical protein [Caudoviricetes sp.]
MTQNELKIFTDMIRQIVKQEISSALQNVEIVVTGKIVSANTNGTFNVELVGGQGVYNNLINKTGATLSVGNIVTLKAKGGNFGNGYIAIKNGM